jgi:hypothetical protein
MVYAQRASSRWALTAEMRTAGRAIALRAAARDLALRLLVCCLLKRHRCVEIAARRNMLNPL